MGYVLKVVCTYLDGTHFKLAGLFVLVCVPLKKQKARKV